MILTRAGFLRGLAASATLSLGAGMAATGGIIQKQGPGTLDHMMLVTMEPNGPFYANTRLSGLMDVAGETGQTRVC